MIKQEVELEIPRRQVVETESRNPQIVHIWDHIQGNRNLSKTVGVARGHQKADTLKP